MLLRVTLLRTDVSEDHIASIIRVTRIGELVTTLKFRSTGKQNQFSHLPAHCRDYIQPNLQSSGPTQHQICGLASHEIIQSPPSCQRPHRTKDTRCSQDNLWVWQDLHWTDGHSVNIRLKEHQRHIRLEHPGKSAVAEHSIVQGPSTQFHNSSNLATKTRYMDHNVSEAIEIELNSYNTTRGRALSQKILELPYLFPKSFRDMTQVHWRRGPLSLTPAMLTVNNPSPRRYGISLCNLAISQTHTTTCYPHSSLYPLSGIPY
jgi:hypothetical protein